MADECGSPRNRKRCFPFARCKDWKATQTVRRVVRNLVLKVELAEPAVGQVQLNLLGELALRAARAPCAGRRAPPLRTRSCGAANPRFPGGRENDVTMIYFHGNLRRVRHANHQGPGG